MALILYPDGTSKEVHPANGDHFEYEELTEIVEGTIEMIPLPDGRIMTLTAEGRPDVEAGIAVCLSALRSTSSCAPGSRYEPSRGNHHDDQAAPLFLWEWLDRK
ncbi:MAG: hypothetical protein E6I90_08305 [Chloroflexi bacterium]|nr:MAG: hypothetical protein E6I90_08305 [Chloroflexota bacterium]